jgi:hypothetical protein
MKIRKYLNQLKEIYKTTLDEELTIVASDPTGVGCCYLTIAGYGPNPSGPGSTTSCANEGATALGRVNMTLKVIRLL